jgi:diguanylate cyclase (GGDEF)-like protein
LRRFNIFEPDNYTNTSTGKINSKITDQQNNSKSGNTEQHKYSLELKPYLPNKAIFLCFTENFKDSFNGQLKKSFVSLELETIEAANVKEGLSNLLGYIETNKVDLVYIEVTTELLYEFLNSPDAIKDKLNTLDSPIIITANSHDISFDSISNSYNNTKVVIYTNTPSFETDLAKWTSWVLDKKEIQTVREFKDSLTGLFNRKYLTEVYNHVEQLGTDVTVALIDVDKFKQVNDTYGHLCGDLVLTKTAEHLLSSLSTKHFVFRLGGEEFTIIFNTPDIKEANNLLEEIRESYSKIVFNFEEVSFTKTFSAGLFSGLLSLTDMLKYSDELLYTAKESGRNNIQVDKTQFRSLSNIVVVIPSNDVFLLSYLNKAFASYNLKILTEESLHLNKEDQSTITLAICGLTKEELDPQNYKEVIYLQTSNLSQLKTLLES